MDLFETRLAGAARLSFKLASSTVPLHIKERRYLITARPSALVPVIRPFQVSDALSVRAKQGTRDYHKICREGAAPALAATLPYSLRMPSETPAPTVGQR